MFTPYLSHTAANPVGSKATVTGSNITGGGAGVVVGSLGELTLIDTNVVATNPNGTGLQLGYGSVSATGGTIRGDGRGILFLPTQNNLGKPGSLVLDGTDVIGDTGSAIVVADLGLAPILATIDVKNGATLTGGNGKILEVNGLSTVNMTVDNSDLVGDVFADTGATANLTLQNHATLTGQLNNVNNLAINSEARWVMVGDGTVTNLELNGGAVQFGNPGDFYKLTVSTLSGTGGTFSMGNDRERVAEGHFGTHQHHGVIVGKDNAQHVVRRGPVRYRRIVTGIGAGGVKPFAVLQIHLLPQQGHSQADRC